MKHKYRIWKNVKGKKLLIQEYAVLTAESRKQKLPGLEDEDFSLLCEQMYPADEVQKAISQGKEELILFLRSQHFFPIGIYMDLIADTVRSMYTAKGEQRETLIFDDKEILLGNLPEVENEALADIEDDSSGDESVNDIDDLLENDSQIRKKDPSQSIKEELPDEEKDY
jgi:hypothetical protein